MSLRQKWQIGLLQDRKPVTEAGYPKRPPRKMTEVPLGWHAVCQTHRTQLVLMPLGCFYALPRTFDLQKKNALYSGVKAPSAWTFKPSRIKKWSLLIKQKRNIRGAVCWLISKAQRFDEAKGLAGVGWIWNMLGQMRS